MDVKENYVRNKEHITLRRNEKYTSEIKNIAEKFYSAFQRLPGCVTAETG